MQPDGQCLVIDYFLPLLLIRFTVEEPSTNAVRKRTLALLNIPSFKETTMN